MIQARAKKSYPILAFEFFLYDGEQPVISLRIMWARCTVYFFHAKRFFAYFFYVDCRVIPR